MRIRFHTLCENTGINRQILPRVLIFKANIYIVKRTTTTR